MLTFYQEKKLRIPLPLDILFTGITLAKYNLEVRSKTYLFLKSWLVNYDY
jgi:hypothetical protein